MDMDHTRLVLPPVTSGRNYQVDNNAEVSSGKSADKQSFIKVATNATISLPDTVTLDFYETMFVRLGIY